MRRSSPRTHRCLGHLFGVFASHRSVAAVAGAVLVAVACQDAAAPEQRHLEVTAGDGQHASVGAALPDYVVVQLRDAAQRPVSGARVAWTVPADRADVITAEGAATDAAGRARARWQLDTTPGRHALSVAAAGAPPVNVSAWADPVQTGSVHTLLLVTYDGSGQLVHPDFARVPGSWGGGPLRLVGTPFPRGDTRFENPSLFAGASLIAWQVPAGVQNPLVLPAGGYLSDPDLLYDPDAGELRIYYRHVTAENEIWLIRSADGVRWSTPVLTVHAPNHVIVSPAVVRRGPGEWLMWSVNAGAFGCSGSSTSVELRRSTDGLAWSNPEVVALREPGLFPWHLDVEWIAPRKEYWAVYPVKVPGSCTTALLRFATSADGVHWRTYPSPVLVRGVIGELQDVVYRSTMDYDAATGNVTLWYSGARWDQSAYAWHLAWEQLSETALFARVTTPLTIASLRAFLSPPPGPTPLTNETAP